MTRPPVPPVAPPSPAAPDRPPPAPAHERRPALGYALVAAGAALFALNGTLARYLLDDGISATRLSQLRSLGSLLALLAFLLVARRDLLRIERRDAPALAVLGVAGLAAVHATYFLAVDRLEIGVAVTIQYLAPVLLLLWLAVAHGRRLPGTLWAAVALAFAGCFLVAEAHDAARLDALGVAAALAAAVTFCIYMVGSERAGRRHAPVTTLVWSFGFASLFWAVAIPWWGFPFEAFAGARNLALGAGIIVLGTLLPFTAIVAGLRHVPASRGAVVATLEPVLAAAIAWLVHDEALSALQIGGGLAVVTAIVWVQSHRPDAEAEAAPATRREAAAAAAVKG